MSEVSLNESQTWRVDLLFQFLFIHMISVQTLSWKHFCLVCNLRSRVAHFLSGEIKTLKMSPTNWFEWLLDKIWTHHSPYLPYLSLYDIISIFIQFLTLLCHWWCGSLNLSTIFNLHSRYWVDRMPVFTFKVSGMGLVYQAGPRLPECCDLF